MGVVKDGAVKPVLCVELEKGANSREEEVRDALLEIGRANSLTESIDTLLFHSGFPVDTRHNSKIFREKLALWAARKLHGAAFKVTSE